MRRDPRIPRWRYLSRHRTWLCGASSAVPFAVVREQLDGRWLGRAWFVRGLSASILVDDVDDPVACRLELVRRMVAYLDAGGRVGELDLRERVGLVLDSALVGQLAGALCLFVPEVP
jgi:hypothetical protein